MIDAPPMDNSIIAEARLSRLGVAFNRNQPLAYVCTALDKVAAICE